VCGVSGVSVWGNGVCVVYVVGVYGVWCMECVSGG